MRTSWPARVIRAVAGINLVLGLLGLFFLVQTAIFFGARVPKADDPAYFAEAYYARTALNLVCLLVLLIVSVPLWRLERRGLLVCNLLFGFEIVYFVLTSGAGLLLSMSETPVARELGHSLAATDGIAEMGLALQVVTGYPLISLIVLNIAYRKLNKPLKQGESVVRETG